VVDELLYGHYLRVTGTDHPGDQEVTASMDCDSECVIKEVILGPRERPIHFFKNMAHHLAGLDRGFLRRITNVLLVRDPKEMLPSLVKQLPCPTLRDRGLKEQVEILGIILEQGGGSCATTGSVGPPERLDHGIGAHPSLASSPSTLP
jgi:Sulfotransferase domain